MCSILYQSRSVAPIPEGADAFFAPVIEETPCYGNGELHFTLIKAILVDL